MNSSTAIVLDVATAQKPCIPSTDNGVPLCFDPWVAEQMMRGVCVAAMGG